MATSTFKKVVLGIALAAGYIWLLGIAGTSDYDEQVLVSMSISEYNSIKAAYFSEYGYEPTDHQLVCYYEARRQKN